MKALYIDIETYSSADLAKCGVYKYAEAPDFEVLLFGYSVDGEDVQVVDLARGEKLPSDIIAALTDETVTKWAFNANFERVCLSRWLGMPLGQYLNPCSYLDSNLEAYTWPDELNKWDHLHGLPYSVAVGTEPERKAALKSHAKVYIINRENVQWLVKENGLPFDYDMVVIDELSSFKSYQAKRFRSLLSVRPMVKRIVGLTGTPSSNGLMDLFAEFRILDMGKRLGRFITHYRNTYFTPDKRNGQVVFSYKPLPKAEEAIYKKISDITISMKATDYLKMPECVINIVNVRLSDYERNIYYTLKRDLVVSLSPTIAVTNVPPFKIRLFLYLESETLSRKRSIT